MLSPVRASTSEPRRRRLDPDLPDLEHGLAVSQARRARRAARFVRGDAPAHRAPRDGAAHAGDANAAAEAPTEWGVIAGTGVILLGFNYALLNWGTRFISSGLTAVLQSITPAFALVFAHFLLPDEKMTPRKLGGLALGVAGITVIFWDQLHFGGRAFTGSVTVTLGAVCVAFAYVVDPAFARTTSIRAQLRPDRCCPRSFR